MQAADTSFLYFKRDLLQPALACLYQSPGEAHKLPYLISAFLASAQILQHAGPHADRLCRVSSSLILCGPAKCPNLFLTNWLELAQSVIVWKVNSRCFLHDWTLHSTTNLVPMPVEMVESVRETWKADGIAALWHFCSSCCTAASILRPSEHPSGKARVPAWMAYLIVQVLMPSCLV